MASRAAYQTAESESDSEIFFASIFGAALVLLLNETLCSLVLRAGDGILGPSLLSRAVPVTSVRLLYTFFVLLPAFVAFAAIGLPFFLRTLRSLFNGRLPRAPKLSLLLLVVGITLAAVELHFGRNGLVSVCTISLVGYVAGFRAIAAVGRAYGFRLLTAAGIALAGLAWYENRVLHGVAPEMACRGDRARCRRLLRGHGVTYGDRGGDAEGQSRSAPARSVLASRPRMAWRASPATPDHRRSAARGSHRARGLGGCRRDSHRRLAAAPPHARISLLIDAVRAFLYLYM